MCVCVYICIYIYMSGFPTNSCTLPSTNLFREPTLLVARSSGRPEERRRLAIEDLSDRYETAL